MITYTPPPPTAPCPTLDRPTDTNGTITYNPDTNVATYGCVTGYTAIITSGDQQRICQSDNTWTGSAATVTCNRECYNSALTQCVSYVLLTGFCPTLTDLVNGQMIISQGFMFQSVALYICNAGYVLTPSTNGGIISCGADGEWSGVEPTCQRELACSGVIW